MKKVLCFIDNLGSGGAQRQLVNIGVGLLRRGYEVEFLVYDSDDFFADTLNRHHIPITHLLTRTYWQRVLRVTGYLRRFKGEAVIAFLEVPGFLACLAHIGRPRWKLITNELSAKSSTFTARRNRFMNLFERFSDAKVCNSQNARAMWENHYPQFKGKYRTIYNPVAIPEDLVLEHRYKADGILHMVVLASYQELKNPVRLVRALSRLSAEERARLRIDWYGQTQMEHSNTAVYDQVVRMIHESHLEKTIGMNGETHEAYGIMAQADMVGLFSTVEGLPNAICEAMTIGRPILMSRVSDHHVLADGNGILCDPESTVSIADALRQAIGKSPEELAAMGKRSAEKAAALFAKDQLIERWIHLLEEDGDPASNQKLKNSITHI